jgi:ribosomal-protein-alanine N-acetyltransferase
MSVIPLLETDRLVLRGFELSDARDVQRLAGEREVADMTREIPHPYADGLAEQWIATHPDTFAAGKGVTFAITRKPELILVGAVSLMNINAGKDAELGYWIGKPFWNSGLCTEACRRVLEYAFAELGLARVFAHHLRRNPASGRVMQKLGMRHEGPRRQHMEKWDRVEDIEVYGIAKDDHVGKPLTCTRSQLRL